jgi:hypothetical protein
MKSILMLPLTLICIIISLPILLIKTIIRHYRDIEGDVRSIIPVLRHKYKLFKKNRKK